MEAFRPNRPTGSTPEARFAQAQWDRAYDGAHVIRNSKDVQVSRTTQGIFLKMRRQRRGGVKSANFPFKIYTFPSSERTTPDADTDWRKFRIRAGAVNANVVSGTDGHDDNPDSDEIDEADMTDISVASGTAVYWFWIDASDIDAPVIDSGADADAPDWGQDFIPIGYVDTDTYSDEKRAVIRQYVRTDLFVCAS